MSTVQVNTIEELNNFMTNALPNDRCVYHTGASLTSTTYLMMLKYTIWEMAIKGFVYLVQKKLGPDKYEFMAIKASENPDKRLIPLPVHDDRPRGQRINIYTYNAGQSQTKTTRKPLLERVS